VVGLVGRVHAFDLELVRYEAEIGPGLACGNDELTYLVGKVSEARTSLRQVECAGSATLRGWGSEEAR
jgi:hypothetical protein